MNVPVLSRPSSRDALVEHLATGHGVSLPVAESLSEMGAALAHATAHTVDTNHRHL